MFDRKASLINAGRFDLIGHGPVDRPFGQASDRAVFETS